MRYSFKELYNAVNQCFRDGSVNDAHEGYPIIHSLLIELRDERDTKKYKHYIKLIQALLLIPDTNINIFDKHLRTPLHYIAADFPPKLSLFLTKLFLRHGADPNILSGNEGETALEFALFRNPSNKKTIHHLNKVTVRTQRFKHHVTEIFDDACGDCQDSETINRIMELKFVDFDPRIQIQTPKAMGRIFNEGFWVRTIENPKCEKKVLQKRQYLTEEQLISQGHDNRTKDPLYTNYSPATFVLHGVPISLFGPEQAGVMIRNQNRQINYWYDGMHGEQLTREMDFNNDTALTNFTKGEFNKIDEANIARHLKRIHRNRINEILADDELDNFGVLAKQKIKEIWYAWNEGLFRYKKQAIFGIYVNPNNRDSCIRALKLRKILDIKVPFYHYDGFCGSLQQIRSRDFIFRHGLDKVNLPMDSRQQMFQRFEEYADTNTLGKAQRREQYHQFKI